jgi:hypothetical protein
MNHFLFLCLLTIISFTCVVAIDCTTPDGPGICGDFTLCTGNRHPVKHYCPGPAAIQCCVANAVPKDFVYVNPYQTEETIGIAIGHISIITSVAVLLTGYMFYEQMVKNKLYMKIILSMSFCAGIGSLSMVFGYPLKEDLCSIQGFVYVFFFRASWFWCLGLTLVLCKQLRGMGKLPITFKTMNIIIWGFNLAITFIPYLDNDQYGLPPTLLGRGFCSLGRQLNTNIKIESTANIQWLNYLFFFPLVICCVVMLFVDGYLYFFLLPNFQSVKIQQLVKNLVFYPVGMFLLWMPTYLVLVSILINKKVSKANNIQQINLQLTNLAGCYSIFLSIVFFWCSFEARRRWKFQFQRWGLYGKDSKAKILEMDNTRGDSIYTDETRNTNASVNNNPLFAASGSTKDNILRESQSEWIDRNSSLGTVDMDMDGMESTRGASVWSIKESISFNSEYAITSDFESDEFYEPEVSRSNKIPTRTASIRSLSGLEMSRSGSAAAGAGPGPGF